MTTAIILSQAQESTTCPICLDDIPKGNDIARHSGDLGEKHSFHRPCLSEWLKVTPTCPIDRQPIDPTGLISQTEFVICKAKSALKQALLAFSLGTTISMLGAATALAMEGTPRLGIGGTLIAAWFMLEETPGEDSIFVSGLIASIISIATTGIFARETTGRFAREAQESEDADRRAGLATAFSGLVASIGGTQILIRNQMNSVAFSNIRLGMSIGAIATGIFASMSPGIAILTGSLLGGFATGFLSLVRE